MKVDSVDKLIKLKSPVALAPDFFYKNRFNFLMNIFFAGPDN